MTQYRRTKVPRFSKGDRVVDFRGELAVITGSIESRDWRSKSHKVTVTWDDHTKNPDGNAYYEEVFEPCSI